MKVSTRLTALFFTLFVTSITVSACAQRPITLTPTLTLDQNTAIQVIDPTSTLAPSQTATIAPTNTQTATITPTHNLAPAATITPQPQTDCPTVDPNTILDTSGFDQLEAITAEAGIGKRIGAETAANAFDVVHQGIINFLNQGGDVSQLISFFAQEEGPEDPRHYTETNVVDITGDNEPEIFILLAIPITFHEVYGYPEPDTGSWFTGRGQHTNFAIFSCQGDRYERLGWFKGPGDMVLPTILDLNTDGIPEMIQPSYSTPPNGGTWLHLEILTWDGEEFTQQISEADWFVTYWYFWEASIRDQLVTVRGGDFDFADIDGNGTIEVVLPSAVFTNSCAFGTRRGDIILQWTGFSYGGYLLRTPPEFRIHAVRDGDHMTAQGYYDEALKFYDQVLHDHTLRTWRPEYTELTDPACSPSPTQPNPETQQWGYREYDRLAAYTLYRLMLLHTAREELDTAGFYYDRLVSEYSSSVNRAYVELATSFWDSYLGSDDLNAACEVARSYAENHEASVLDPLGSYYDKEYARRYVAQDICPFGIVPAA